MFFNEDGEFILENNICVDKKPEKTKKTKKYDIFKDVILNITNGKTKLIWDSELEKIYNQFLINRCLISNPKYISLIAHINSLGSIPNIIHYDILFNTIPKKKQFNKMFNVNNINKHLELIAEKYNISINEISLFYDTATDEDKNVLIAEAIEYEKNKKP